jgi:hypothetical protein
MRKYRRARNVEISIAFGARVCYICVVAPRARQKGVLIDGFVPRIGSGGQLGVAR